MKVVKRLGAAVGMAAALFAFSTPAQAKFPERPIRVVCPFAAGGATDAIARVIATSLSERIGQPVTVDNVTGGATVIATQAVIDADPDGYTLLFHSGTLAIDRSYKSNLPYDMKTDLIPITKAAWGPLAVLVSPSIEANTLGELIQYQMDNPGALNFGSGGTGTMLHLAAEYLNAIAGVEATHIAYRGGGPATAALLAGEIDMMMKPPFTSTSVISEGKVKALAVTGRERSVLLPDVPTVIEQGYETYVSGHWGGFFAPAGTPDDVVATLNAEIVAAIKDPRVEESLTKRGLLVIANSQAEFKAELDEEVDLWKKVITDAGIATQ